MEDNKVASFYVIASFIMLFFIFMFLQPKTTSYAIGSILTNTNSSLLIIVVVFIVLIVALGIVYFVYRNIKKKKTVENVPLPKKEVEEKDILEGIAEKKGDLSGIDVDKLFSGGMKEEKKEEKPIEKKILTNLNELKIAIINLLRQRYNKQQILSLLSSKGWTLEQIEKAIEDINLDNLKAYVNNSLKEGFSKESIKQFLLKNGWSEDLIDRALR